MTLLSAPTARWQHCECPGQGYQSEGLHSVLSLRTAAFEGVDHIMEPIRSTLTSHDPPGNHGEGGVFNTQAGAQQNENVNLKSKGCCGAVSDGFMPVASAGRLGAFSSMW